MTLSRTLAIRLPYSSLERDFRHRRQTPRNREDDISEQRPPRAGNGRKMAFLLASCQLRVSEERARTWDPLIKSQLLIEQSGAVAGVVGK
jgi:hypothetical protein